VVQISCTVQVVVDSLTDNMDNNQIKLYVEQNIKSQEPGLGSDPRLALELSHFTASLCLQAQTLNRVPTHEQILQAWKNWKLERITYVEHVRSFTGGNKERLTSMAAERVIKIETDQRFQQEIPAFATAFANRLQHLAKEPLPEHIDRAWESWKKGYHY
jgi:hypothetical protein